ncbi:restriction endonuclease subunit S [Sinisalibacter lacisalsi]|uniref:Type I restriction modification DNA specificity domain-containing protein n=1 Tax=Sinisalibacter lacisalsi TaxID=1526570 RepID=A0ABQ1QP41_9RHOB|nr:restriction endonuclease subunit S [Sinisalibacter lacisalsi]GGD39038.1 hypothetical protein GCM10011358_23720 [Sinisalibacter lacisalsi]
MKGILVDGWKMKPLSEIATFSNGLWKGKKGPFTTAKVLRNTNFRPHGVLSLDDVAEIEVETKHLQKRRLQRGDIILERSGGGPKQPVGRVVLFNVDEGTFSFSNFTSVIRIADRSEVVPAYLHQVLNWWHASGVTEGLQSRSTGIRNLDFKSYKELAVPLPPLEEQRRIVAVLDEAFEGLARARAHAAANLQNARELFEVAIESALREAGGEPISLAKLLEKGWIKGHLDGNHGSNYPRKAEFVGDGIPYISANCIDGDVIDMSRCKYLTPHRADALRKGIARDRDVIFAHNATVGPVALLSTDEPKVILSTSLTYYRCDEAEISPEFLVFEMRSAGFKRQYEAVMSQATRNQVPITMQRRFEHLIPPMDAQLRIAELGVRLERDTRTLTDSYNRTLADLDDLRQSLLEKAFSGQLVT